MGEFYDHWNPFTMLRKSIMQVYYLYINQYVLSSELLGVFWAMAYMNYKCVFFNILHMKTKKQILQQRTRIYQNIFMIHTGMGKELEPNFRKIDSNNTFFMNPYVYVMNTWVLYI